MGDVKLRNWAGLFPIFLLFVTASAPTSAKISASEVSAIVEDSKVLGSDTEVRSEVLDNEREVDITTVRNPKATDRDCKIDAALIARKVIDAYPCAIAKVKVVFFDRSNTNKYRQVTVHEADVKAFANRQIGQDSLLSGIELVNGRVNPVARLKGLSYKEISGTLEVIPGAYRQERAQLLSEITALKSKGAGAGPLLAQFFRIEDKVRQGDQDGVASRLKVLQDKVKEQAEHFSKVEPEGSVASPRGDDLVLQPLGELAPAEGLMYNRRLRAARKVAELRDTGKPVNRYLRLLGEFEGLAASGNRATLNTKLGKLEQMLGLPEDEKED
jgi:hypothetical protein